jgi:hypothetical protein
MSLDLKNFKPGQPITCTITAEPRTADERQTIERLMRLDPANKRALARAQRMRAQRIVIYNRGNRDWVKREKTARVVRVEKAATWTMPYRNDLISDLHAIANYISVK